MKLQPIIGFFLLTLCSLNAFNNAAFASSSPINTISDFVKLPNMRNAQISPDGLHMSVKFLNDGEQKLAIINLKDNKVVSSFGVSGIKRSVGDVHWVSNQRVLFSVQGYHSWDKTPFETGELYGANIDGSKYEMIFGYSAGFNSTGTILTKKRASYGSHEIIDLLAGDDDHVLIAFYPWSNKKNLMTAEDYKLPKILKLDVFSGRTQTETELPIAMGKPIADATGKVRFTVGRDDDNVSKVFYRDLKSETWSEFSIKDFEAIDIRPISFSADNKSVYLIATENNGTEALYQLELDTQIIKKIFQNPRVDISTVIRDFNSNDLIAVGTDQGLPEYHYLNEQNTKTKIHKALRKLLKGQDLYITSVTKNIDKIIVKSYSDTIPGTYYLFDTIKGTMRFLFSEMGQINTSKTAKMIPKQFTMRDGTLVYGYLTIPNKQSKNMPLVVMPHGGPHGVRDFWGFDWVNQLLANAGFAVLQVNFRGSGGYGYKFETDGHLEWGALMQDDITDATQSLIVEKLVDPKRICIFGASYGGYASLMGVVREPDLYRCAIGSMGVYDLPMMFTKGDIPETARGLTYLQDALGTDIDDQKKRSPVYNVEKIKAEILLIHGKQDKRAPIEQVEALKLAFDKIGKKYQWLELSDEGHGYYDEENRLNYFSKVVAFLNANIGEKSK